jgi:hypothetical protein
MLGIVTPGIAFRLPAAPFNPTPTVGKVGAAPTFNMPQPVNYAPLQPGTFGLPLDPNWAKLQQTPLVVPPPVFPTTPAPTTGIGAFGQLSPYTVPTIQIAKPPVLPVAKPAAKPVAAPVTAKTK